MCSITVHTETNTHPFKLVFGKISRFPLYNFDDYLLELKYRLQTAWNGARNNLLASKLKRKKRWDERKVRNVNVRVGGKVLIRNMSNNTKSDLIFKGPYDVVEDRNPHVIVNIGNKLVEIHRNKTKLYNH